MRCSGLMLLLAAALAASGCANHVRYLDVQDERLDTVLVSTEYEVDGGGAKIVSSRVAVEFLRIDHFEDRTERTTIKYEEATPYQAWRELYEAPAGLVSDPLSVAFNFLRVALLFYIPAATRRLPGRGALRRRSPGPAGHRPAWRRALPPARRGLALDGAAAAQAPGLVPRPERQRRGRRPRVLHQSRPGATPGAGAAPDARPPRDAGRSNRRTRRSRQGPSPTSPCVPDPKQGMLQ